MHTIHALEMHAAAHIQQTVMVATATPMDVTSTVTIKDDKALANSESLITGVSGNSVTEDYCVAQRAAFGDNTSFMDKGGLATLSAALAKPMVLVMSLWDDHAANMLWLDSTYPMDSTKLGATRGSCATSSGVPADVDAEQPRGTVTVQAGNNLFSNMKGHAFDIYDSTSALLEGNMFGSVDSPMASYTGLIYNVPDSSSASACSSTLGRACEVNTVTGSGGWPSLTNTAALTTINRYTSKMYVVTPLPDSSVKNNIDEMTVAPSMEWGMGQLDPGAKNVFNCQPPAAT
ncbi:hypothetical protein V499_02978 [Pseudogymnoascus sp. VKM F-103]|nr:hypothetical protein V499_02978 [Pseudogymnoascus sp. VKM F-103]